MQHAAHVGGFAFGLETGVIFFILFVRYEYAVNDNQHEDARQGGRDAGAQQSELRERAYAVNQQVVSHDVEQVGTDHDPHRRTGVADAVEELFESVEKGLDGYGKHDDDVVRPDFGEKLFGLSHVPQEKVEYPHQQEQHHAQCAVDLKSGFQCLAGILEFSPGVHGAYDRSDGVRITQGKNQHQHHDVVDEACGGQGVRTEMTHHDGVSQSLYDGT